MHKSDISAPLLLYAHDLILISTSPEGLQRHLDALATACEQRQLTINLSKTKVVIFKAQKSDCKDLCFNGTIVEHHERVQIPWLCVSCHNEHGIWH